MRFAIGGAGMSRSRKSSHGKMTNPVVAAITAARRCPSTTAENEETMSVIQIGPAG